MSKYGLSPVVIIFNDNAWGVLKDMQKALYKSRYMAVDLQNPNFVKLAESYGANGIQVASIKELAPALESALESDTITLIDVLTPNGIENFA